jgi:radical SAM superfamily enzyme YgiQ (UPF0313 family)
MKSDLIIPSHLLHDILPLVERPTRYIGGERGSCVKEFEKCDARIALGFPDVYEIASGNLGQEILYHIVNSKEIFLAERVYAPWIDMEKKLADHSIPLYTLESKIPVREFDILGFTVSYELGYTSLLTILNSSGLPLHSSERTFPIVGMGGSCAFNPSVMTRFVDFFHLGDGEENILAIANVIAEYRKEIDKHRDDKNLKNEILKRLSSIPGVYVPGMPVEWERRSIIPDLENTFFPTKTIVPYFVDMKSRVTLELFRGCTQGCRFCQAGYLYRPYRKRSAETLLACAHASIEHSGYTEISLSSLNTTDYPELKELVERLIEMRGFRPLKISIPSSRISSFSSEFAEILKPYSSGSITLAIEAGTERLRRIINKHTSDEDITSAVRSALMNGLNQFKLYFMIGLPTETDDDILAINDVVGSIRTTWKHLKGHGEIPKQSPIQIKVSIANFVPKPHTPFQWCAMDSIETQIHKHDLLKPIRTISGTRMTSHPAESSFIEGVLSRGDEQVGAVVESVWKAGSRFETWKERLNFKLWMDSFQSENVNPEDYISEKSEDYVFPWDSIPTGISRSFLWNEYQKALNEIETRDCFEGDCAGCGIWKEVCANLPRKK